MAALNERILVLDGATGTALQGVVLTADDFGGPELEGCNEILCVSRPDVVDGVHETYLSAGADIVETNTFGGAPIVLAEYDLADRAFEINKLAAEIARTACERWSTAEKPRFVCGSMGPTTKAISVTGGVTFDELRDGYRIQALGLMAGGADYLLLETCQDTRNVKAGLLAIRDAFDEAGWSVPVAVSATIETMGTMLGGQDAEALAVSLLHTELLYVGLNCATGPELMSDHLRTLSEICRSRVACVPNAGLPNEDGIYLESADDFRQIFSRFLDADWLNLVGGCCGTTRDHVAALADLVVDRQPRRVPEHHRALISGLEAVELTPDNRPLLVGERTNVLGSRAFRTLIQAGDFEAAAEVGRAQVRSGGQVIDVCLQDPERDEHADMEAFLEKITRLVKVPLMIDSTDPSVMEMALEWCQGKAVLNSTNLEDGPERLGRVAGLATRYGASVVVGLIDEQGMAVDLGRKQAVAHRSRTMLVEDFGMRDEDIWWDALVFPCATGDENYIGSAKATIEGIRWLKSEMPDCRTILGVSNVSFGLPTSGREVLNSVFLYHCTKAGLDAAIVNTQRLARYAEIPTEERKLSEALLFLEPSDREGSERAIEAFTEHFRGRKPVIAADVRAAMPVEERLARAIVEGTKEGLIESLEEALVDGRWPGALDVINGPLMTGMAEVGRLFNNNELIVAEVLQSAEVMKASVSHLEQYMEHTEGSRRGKVLLATVKGDVHDIGKNLVDIILTNNGFEVINLGIKVPSEQLIQAVRDHQPNLIGLSGLLVKSAQQMISTASDLKAVGIDTDLVVGGAALSRRFTHKRISPEYGGVCTYASDAMAGLDLIERLTTEDTRSALLESIRESQEKDREAVEKEVSTEPAAQRPAESLPIVVAPWPPDTELHTETPDLDEVWGYINPQMLLGKHLGLRGSIASLRAAGDPKLASLEALLAEVKAEARDSFALAVQWRFFPAQASGNTLTLFDPETGDPAASWELPRQVGGDERCLTDYVMADDHVPLFLTTAGRGPRELSLKWKDSGDYLKSHAVASLALETAEAAAEWLHCRLRGEWGFPDPADLPMASLLAGRYRGRRYSFGYPACPDLGGQQALFAALDAQAVGIELTEGDMMDPEASVSALVFHHPDAKYFAV